MNCIKIASLQTKVYEDKYENIEKLAELIASGAVNGADIISLPEMWNCPYQTENFPVYAEPEQGDSWLALSTLARKNSAYVVGGSIPELGDDGKVYNNLKFRDDSEAKIEGIEAFLDKSGQAYAGRLGAPFGKVLLIAFIIALLGAGLVCLGVVLKYNMKTKQNIYPLEHYTKMKLNDSSDVFKGSYVRKRIIQTSSGGRSGGSSGGAGGGSGHRGGR